ncbi:MAG TPA: cobalamin-independent methionine synthase II family protein [Chloroflexota bacterium]
MTATYRADHVGSLLRPPDVLEAHTKYEQGQLPLEELRKIEDRAILEALDMQRQVGLEVLSDGEYRRQSWAGDFYEAVDGYVDGPLPIRFDWRLPDGAPRTPSAQQEVEQMRQSVPMQSGRVIGERLRQKRRLTEHESGFMKQHAGTNYKVTQPAASYIVTRSYNPSVSGKAYPTRQQLCEEVARIVASEVQALAAEGVPYIQIDNAHYPDYIPQERREQMRSIGIDPDTALAEDIAADNATLRVDRSRHVVAMHICRGNGRSAYHTSGPYDAIAEQVFGGLDVDRFLLEYDDPNREGGFEPLRFIPKGKQVVLGLVTTKVGQLESQDVLLKRIEEAAKYVPMENLALSPQCGFASVIQGNLISPDEQRRKLELVVETARKAWG